MTTEAEIRKWIADYPRDWDQRCQALMWRLCERFGSVPVDGIGSAFEAYRIERDAGRLNTGPIPKTGGVFVYFDIGADDHVGYVMNDGRVFMTGRKATGRIVEEWGNRDVGWNTVAGYIRATGAKLYGWSRMNGGNTVNNWVPNWSVPAQPKEYEVLSENDPIVKELREGIAEAKAAAEWSKQELGGSVKDDVTVASRLRQVNSKLDMVLERLEG